jgi:SAM-dependent methyltransferase
MIHSREYWEGLSASELRSRHWTLEDPALVSAVSGWRPLQAAASQSDLLVVDIGCGNGALDGLLSLSATSTYIGIDIRPRAAYMDAPSVHRKAYVVADAVQLPIKSSSAGLVFAINVVPFILEETAALIAEIDRVLAPRGRCCLTYPTASQLWASRGPAQWPAESVLPAFVARGFDLIAEQVITAEPRGVVRADLEPEIGKLWLLEKVSPQRKGATHVAASDV